MSRRLKRFAALVAAVMMGTMMPTAARAASYWYEAQNDARSWNHQGAWFYRQGGTTHVSGLEAPTSSDDASIGNESVALPNYLNVTNGVTATVNTLGIGSVANRTIGVMVAGGTLTAADSIRIASGADSGGVLVLSNATVQLTNGTLGERLFVGYGSGSWGVLRGWGTVTGGSKNAYMTISRGQVIADGFGEQKTLDVGSLAGVKFGGEWTVAATNGWYAVNKGKVQFPRIWLEVKSKDETSSHCCGDYGAQSPTNQVNGVHFSISGFGSTGVRYFRCALYADDRSDVHLDSLPANNGIVGTWSMRFDDGKYNCGVNNIDLTFHFDPAKAKTGQSLMLLRWNGASWDKVAEGMAAPDHLFSVSGLKSLSGQSENIGTFALVKKRVGLMIFIE